MIKLGMISRYISRKGRDDGL